MCTVFEASWGGEDCLTGGLYSGCGPQCDAGKINCALHGGLAARVCARIGLAALRGRPRRRAVRARDAGRSEGGGWDGSVGRDREVGKAFERLHLDHERGRCESIVN